MKFSNCKIIAEIGWNYMGNMNLAKKMVIAAKKAGADYAKFQTWSVSRLKNGPWDKDGRREIYDKAALTSEKVSELQKMSNKVGCDFLISVFGTIGAKVISDLGIRNIKIPSHETTNKKLIEFCSTHFDYIYFSAGASSEDDVQEAVKTLKPLLSKKIICGLKASTSSSTQRIRPLSILIS